MSEEEKQSACKGDQRILSVVIEEMAALGCPAKQAGLATWFKANTATAPDTPLALCLESLKLRHRVLQDKPAASWAKEAKAALEANPQQTLTIWQVIQVE